MYRTKNLEGISKKNSRRGIGKLEPVVSNVLILTAEGLHCLLRSLKALEVSNTPCDSVATLFRDQTSWVKILLSEETNPFGR